MRVLNDKTYDDLLSAICDICRHCYEGLSEEQFEQCCSDCKPIDILTHSYHVSEDQYLAVAASVAYSKFMQDYRNGKIDLKK